MLKHIKLYLIPLVLIFIFSACEESELNSKVSLKINPDRPLVINADTVRRVTTIIDGEENVQILDVPGPWMSIGFDFRNENDNAITIIALTLFVTGPDGTVRTSNVLRFDGEGLPVSFFAVIRAENDVNCDGIVDEAEKVLVDPVLNEGCPLDDSNPSFNGARAVIENLLSGVENIETYRNASYQVRARFEGWLGLPTDTPQENFFKEYVFSATTN